MQSTNDVGGRESDRLGTARVDHAFSRPPSAERTSKWTMPIAIVADQTDRAQANLISQGPHKQLEVV